MQISPVQGGRLSPTGLAPFGGLLLPSRLWEFYGTCGFEIALYSVIRDLRALVLKLAGMFLVYNWGMLERSKKEFEIRFFIFFSGSKNIK